MRSDSGLALPKDSGTPVEIMVANLKNFVLFVSIRVFRG